MIQSDDELKIVRDQMTRAESALEALRREVLPKSARMYQVMSEAYVDTIVELRGQIDTYLGINVIPQNADLVISLEGDHVGFGQTSAAVVTRFIDTFRRGIQSAVEIVETVQRQATGRRRERWVERICDLAIVGLAPGSVKVMLAEPQDQSLFSAENREALQKAIDLVFKGLSWADVNNAESPSNSLEQEPPETRQAILALVTQLLPPRSGDVSRVSFFRKGLAGTDHSEQSATLTRASRSRVRSALEKTVPESQFTEVQGVIRKLDLDDRSFVLRERIDDGADVRFEYGPELDAAVKESLDCRVIVTGSRETDRKGKEKLLADSIEVENDNASEDLPDNLQDKD
jgi:hypothetical protein